ncbi:transcriptional regulator [Chromobacterium sphagni]|uniref:Transcriptional regulator n=1 Tax=Chromobacterium sphagni TaxID=1903179 RepID=A0A1S1WXG3_9NEIS|nr:helix-turn-helix transcriptional regulator [Chromobacterium sphagni]OHX11745.1 transcriptional regulator [Chromobacterium sphagni]
MSNADRDVEQLNLRVAKTVARYRKARGLTQDGLAEQLGIGLEAVSRLERGRITPTLPRLLGLAQALQCGVNDLLAETSPNPSDQAAYLEQLLSPLSQEDRALVVEMVERLSARLTPVTPR